MTVMSNESVFYVLSDASLPFVQAQLSVGLDTCFFVTGFSLVVLIKSLKFGRKMVKLCIVLIRSSLYLFSSVLIIFLMKDIDILSLILF